ncbi:MAG: peroxidase [Sphingobacteriaceae bacterium]|nr:peroxidase [Cytophagaceae bacterium]
MPLPLDLNDMQGLLVRAYSHLPEACYLMLTFGDEARGRVWLRRMADRVTRASVKPDDVALHLALSNRGVFRFLPKTKLAEQFSREFTDGMVAPERSRILGDLDTNQPENWNWGGPAQPVDAVLMLFAADKTRLETTYQDLHDELETHAIREVIRLDTHPVPQQKEHFGFRDGLSQPLIIGLEKEGSPVDSARPPADETERSNQANRIRPGEFILGYENEYGKIPFSPKAKTVGGAAVDLGKNGSYLVFRQLRQDVKTFWEFMNDTARTNPYFAGHDAVYIAAKLVGRWPNGNPLTTTPNPQTPPVPEEHLNAFLYKTADQHGFGCPIGAHIRKSNPRDGIDSDPDTSIEVSKRHRILRRGRSFGEPLAESMEPEAMLASERGGDRGLYFICLNTNIGRQFEFIQHTWDNNSKFDGLYNDVDPISGFAFLKYQEDKYVPGEFTIQDQPVRKKVKDIPQFVYVQGGAYFFVPGLRTLRLIADADTKLVY